MPDSDSVREKRLQDFSAGEAASFATALSSYSTQSHGALLRNAAFLNGTLAQGETGRSLDRVLAHAYCREGSGSDTNHMLISWYTQSDRDGEFTVKGIGKGAGASIVQALSTHAAPQMIGYYGEREVRLRGPRRNGETELSIPAGCDLDIPAGAPVLVLEHISPSDQVGVAGGSYEYRTVSCEDTNDIGARTERRAIRTQDDGTVSRGTWEVYDDTCNGAVSTRAVSIERSIGNLIGALDLSDAGSLQGALSGLAGLDCVKVKTGEKQTDADGNEIEVDEELADTCDTNNIDVTKYLTDKDMSRTDDVRSREEMSVSCGRGRTGTLPRGQHDASYQGYTGSLNLHSGWSGTATYERFTFNAEQQGGGESSVDGTQKGLWQGHELLCNRAETMTVDCYDVFPEYRGLRPVSLGGMSVRRTNRISGWETKSPPNPNKPLAGTVGWVQAGASCKWLEDASYSCCEKLGEGWSLVGGGSKERYVTGVSIKSSSEGPWRDLGAASCRKPYDYYWDDCTTTCTGSGEDRVCEEHCITRHEIRYHRASTSLHLCEGIEDVGLHDPDPEVQTEEEKAESACKNIADTMPELKTSAWGGPAGGMLQTGRFSCCESSGMRTVKPGLVSRGVKCTGGASVEVGGWNQSGMSICATPSGGQTTMGYHACQGANMTLVDHRLATMMDMYHAGIDITNGNLRFDEAYYLAQYPDVAAAIARGEIASAADHFANYGYREGRVPNPAVGGLSVDTQEYLRNNPDVLKAIAEGTLDTMMAHIIRYGQNEGREDLTVPLVAFDANYYLANNPDVRAAMAAGTMLDPYDHYVKHGMFEGRAPNADMASSLLYYGSDLNDIGVGPMGSNTGYDVKQVIVPPPAGGAQGVVDAGMFNEAEYLRLNPDVAVAIQNGQYASGTEHYYTAGYAQKLVPSNAAAQIINSFDPVDYVTQNPDVLESIGLNNGTAFDHLMYNGLAEHEGRGLR